MKKIIMMVLVLCMGFSLAGCNNKINKDVKISFIEDTHTLEDDRNIKTIGVELSKDVDIDNFEESLRDCIKYLDEDIDFLTILTFPKGDKNSKKIKPDIKGGVYKYIEDSEERSKNAIYTIGIQKNENEYEYTIYKYKEASEGAVSSGVIKID